VTILAALRNRAAIVLGSDSEERSTSGRRRTTKLVVPQRNLVLAWAGYKDVAQAMALSLQEEPLDLDTARSRIARAATDRFRMVRTDPDVEHRSEMNEFMLAWYYRPERKPVGLHLPSQGSAVWVEQWQYAGSQTAVSTARVAEASVSYLVTEDLGVEQLTLVALKVLRDAISAAPSAAGIGGPVQLATVTSDGVRVLEAEELRAGNDALDVWQERCAELLPGAMSPRSVDARDPGLGPPA